MTDQDQRIDRRSAIQKGVAAGVVAGVTWSAPKVHGLTLRPNYAAAASGGGPVINRAPGGVAQQSGIAFGGPASRGNDNNTDGTYNNNSTFHTTETVGAWWEVDLGQVCDIEEVRLWNRTDCCQTRATDVQVFVDGALVGTAPGVVGSPSTVAFAPVAGQVVRVVNGFVGAQWFHLAEVQVFA